MNKPAYDVYGVERAKAVNEGNLLVNRFVSKAGKPAVMIFKPKAFKPYGHYHFQTEGMREIYIQNEIKKFAEYQQAKLVYRSARKGTAEQIENVKIGSIFYWSWGYDQTNCNFFQIVDKKGSFVFIREIAQKSIDGSQAFMSELRLPLIGEFLEGKGVMKKKVQFSNGKAYLTIDSFGWCSMWDGQAKNCSWYA